MHWLSASLQPLMQSSSNSHGVPSSPGGAHTSRASLQSVPSVHSSSDEHGGPAPPVPLEACALAVATALEAPPVPLAVALTLMVADSAELLAEPPEPPLSPQSLRKELPQAPAATKAAARRAFATRPRASI